MGCLFTGYLDVRKYFFANEVKMIKVIKVQDLHVNGLGTRGFPIADFCNELVRGSTQTIRT